jgi:alkylation response protein AidB-like acyl-CoA dehydrogenase
MTSLPRTVFSEEHEQFREMVRRFCEEKITPFHDEWAEKHIVPRSLWLEARSALLSRALAATLRVSRRVQSVTAKAGRSTAKRPSSPTGRTPT